MVHFKFFLVPNIFQVHYQLNLKTNLYTESKNNYETYFFKNFVNPIFWLEFSCCNAGLAASENNSRRDSFFFKRRMTARTAGNIYIFSVCARARERFSITAWRSGIYHEKCRSMICFMLCELGNERAFKTQAPV